MATTKVTLALTPVQFELIRDAVQLAFNEHRRNGDDTNRAPELRRGDKTRALQFADLHGAIFETSVN